MKARWIALGLAGFAACLIATIGVTYAVLEWRNDDSTQATVIGLSDEQAGNLLPPPLDAASPVRRYCVSYSVAGTVAEWCEQRIRGDPPDCYVDAEVGKTLPSSCARHED